MCTTLGTNFRQETPPHLRLDHAYLIKKLDGTYVMAEQCEAPTATTELLTRLIVSPYAGLEPATKDYIHKSVT